MGFQKIGDHHVNSALVAGFLVTNGPDGRERARAVIPGWPGDGFELTADQWEAAKVDLGLGAPVPRRA